MKIYPKAEDNARAIREWVHEEIKSTPSHYNLGKFFFTVSTGTLGAIVGLVKSGPTNSNIIDVYFGFSIVFIFAAVCAAVYMMIPHARVVRGDTNLFDTYKQSTRFVLRSIWAWFILWLLGTGFGLLSIFLTPPLRHRLATVF